MEIKDVSQSTNLYEIAEVIQRLNPNAEIRVASTEYDPQATSRFYSSVPMEQLVLPEGFYANEKNEITNKNNTQNSIYCTLSVEDLSKADERNLLPKFEKIDKVDTAEVDNPSLKNKETYDDVINELVNNCYLSIDEANDFIKRFVKDAEIRKYALDYFERKEKEDLKDEHEQDDEKQQTEEKDFSGIDNSAPADMFKPIKVKTEKPKPSLIRKFKEKWKNSKFKKKVIVGAGITAIGLVAAALNPEIQSFVSNLLTSFGPDQISSNITDAITNINSGIADTIAQNTDTIVQNVDTVAQNVDVATLDTSSLNLEGLNIADNAYDAASGNTPLTANEYFSNNLQGFYDTSTGQMLDVSPEDLQNADAVNNILQNNNVSAVFGNGEAGTLDEVSGFVNGNDLQEVINQGRSR